MTKADGNKHRPTWRFVELSKQECRFLTAIARKGIVDQSARQESELNALVARGLIFANNGHWHLTREGKQALRRLKLAKEEEQIFAAQHQDRVDMPISQTDASQQGFAMQSAQASQANHVRVNRSESPLQMLASRKRPDGSSYLKTHWVAAGERLRQDFEMGQLSPCLGLNWDRLGEAEGSKSKKARTGGQGAMETDRASAAQQRFRKAVDYVGEELAGILIDFCCFLKGLEEIERTRQWPARSAKQILSLALQRLARHYGLGDVATGPSEGRMQHWGVEDYRPKL